MQRAVESDSENRDRVAEELVVMTGDRREALDRVRARFQRRLLSRSDDFEATKGLRVVERALPRTSYRDGPWQAQQREARRSYRELDGTQVSGVEIDV
jgi:hypothetical protein